MSIADQIEQIVRALTAEDLARLLSVSRVTIFKQAAAGRIPSFRVGTCMRFDPKSVANWLRSMWNIRLLVRGAVPQGDRNAVDGILIGPLLALRPNFSSAFRRRR